MDAPSTSAAALKLEIARLTGVINRHKTGEPHPRSTGHPVPPPRSNVYINPDYKPPSKHSTPAPVQPPPKRPTPLPNTEKKEVVIGGVAFESSGRSLVRKDVNKPPSTTDGPPQVRRPPASQGAFARNKAGALVNSNRTYKSKTSRRGRGRGPARNMTLNNTVRPYHSRRISNKRKYSDKPCPRFTTTGASLTNSLSTDEDLTNVTALATVYPASHLGACNRGLTCMYQHDPSKIAICWNFLQGNCPNTAETCPLSHDPTPERTPLCVHFANNGRCTRPNCPFPHVRVGKREGVCRDFAVLGYCEKGLDCDKQHVRECPDFAEKGACTTKGCKLPHVIRANRSRKEANADSGRAAISSNVGSADQATAQGTADSVALASASSDSGADTFSIRPVFAEDAQLGDEFISLTFHESESEDESDDEDNGDEEEDDDGDEDEDVVLDENTDTHGMEEQVSDANET